MLGGPLMSLEVALIAVKAAPARLAEWFLWIVGVTSKPRLETVQPSLHKSLLVVLLVTFDDFFGLDFGCFPGIRWWCKGGTCYC